MQMLRLADAARVSIFYLARQSLVTCGRMLAFLALIYTLATQHHIVLDVIGDTVVILPCHA